jgi:predicted nucleic acid-binding protein
MMRALFDTNILLDIGLARKPFAEVAFACLAATQELGEPPRVAPHALATFYYIVSQARGTKQANAAIADLIAISEVVPFDHKTAHKSLTLNFNDFEDAMIAATAEAADLDCIVTRNGNHFKQSPVPALSPEVFLGKIGL